MKWSVVKLHDICRPKQWPTISIKDLKDEGFPVYGANGRIGYYDKFTHEYPTLLITCRGATCGTINICESRSYVTGNSMALDNLDERRVVQRFLFHFLRQRRLDDVISGSAQPQITREGLTKVEIPLPPLAEQQRIAEILDRAEALRAKRRAALAHLDTLTQAIFLEKFGNPATNAKDWPRKSLMALGKVTTGGTPPSAKDGMFNGPIPFVTPGDLERDEPVKRSLTNAGAEESVTVRAGATLVCCIGATIGKMAKARERSAFNQQINAVEWTGEIDDSYGLAVLRFFKPTIVAWGASTTLPILKKSTF
ncbi:MAG: restriction endonuclease subunit S [Syntrophales bacterium]|nr:restriction endonuclease subunit S [Syntrophales bacterium]